MANKALNVSKVTKNNEFYTQYKDVEKEIENYIECDHGVFKDKTILLPCDDYDWSDFTKYFVDNFERFGLKKLISTSYAKRVDSHDTRGKLFMLTRSKDGSGRGDKFSGYLEGDGDFRSEEVTALRDEADIIVTNPPFSLFREFFTWIVEANKRFMIIGNMNAINYKEVFPLIKSNEVWLGTNTPKEFVVPSMTTKRKNTRISEDGTVIAKFGNICWFTNINHGMRNQKLSFNTMEHNLKFNKKLKKKLEKDYGKLEYPHYENYDAIEVPFVESIPSDYDGMMGVPITFMNKYNPEQFEIVDSLNRPVINKKTIYKRIIIRLKHENKKLRTGEIIS